MTRDWRLVPLVYALCGIVLLPLAEWLATAPLGVDLLLLSYLVFLLPAVLAVGCLPVLVLAMCFQSSRRRACLFFLFAFAGFIGGWFGFRLGDIARMSGMRKFAQRSEAIVTAIHQYEQEHGVPPADLTRLVPKYMAGSPYTGMAAYPDYRYHQGMDALEGFFGNSWALSVFTPRGLINFDMMVYLPKQNYPEHGFGGVLERVGSWAYVHE